MILQLFQHDGSTVRDLQCFSRSGFVAMPGAECHTWARPPF